MPNLDLISVILPVFNGEDQILRTIESLLSQTYPFFEIIVIDDGSTDSTSKILSGLHDDRIQLIKLEKNVGIASALNIGLNYAKGEFIARVDSDDYSEPNRFELQIKFLKENPDFALCGTYQKIVGGYKDGFNKTAENDREIRTGLLFGPTILHSTVMFRRAAIDQFMPNLYNLDRYLCEDYDLWVRISQTLRCYTIPEYLCHYLWEGPKNWESDNSRLIKSLNEIWRSALERFLIYKPGNFTLKAHQTLSGRSELKAGDIFGVVVHSISLLVHLLFRYKNYSIAYGSRLIFRRVLSLSIKLFINSRVWKIYSKMKRK